MAGSNQQLVVQVYAKLDQLKAAMTEGTNVISTTTAAMEKMSKSLNGDRMIQAAHTMAASIQNVGGVSTLTSSQMERANSLFERAAEKLELTGRGSTYAADQFRKLADSTKQAESSTDGLTAKTIAMAAALGTMAGNLAGEGLNKMFSMIKGIGPAIVDMGIHGSEIANVEHGFQQLAGSTANAHAIMLAMQAGTRNTIDDFALMKDATKLLSAGVELTAVDFGTLTQASVVLAHRGFGDTTEILDKLSTAMITGRAKTVAKMLGVIDAKGAELEYQTALDTGVDKLTAIGKAEAVRQEIMSKLSTLVKDAGEQQITFAERIAQAKTAVANFTDSLSVAIATSPVLNVAFETMGSAFTSALGTNQVAMVETLIGVINKVAIFIVNLGIGATQVATVFVSVWSVIKTAVLGVETVIVGIVTAIGEVLLKAEQMAGKLHLVPPEEVATLKNTQIGLRGMTVDLANQTAEAAKGIIGQSALNQSIDKVGGALYVMRDKMEAASAAGVTHAQVVNALGAAHDASTRHVDKMTTAQQAFAKATAEIESAGDNWRATLDTIDGSVVESIQHYLEAGISQGTLATYYGLTAVQVKAVDSAIKAHTANMATYAKVVEHESSPALEEFSNKLQKLGTAVPQKFFDDLDKTAHGLTMVERSIPPVTAGFYGMAAGLEAVGQKSTEIDELRLYLAKLPKTLGQSLGDAFANIPNLLVSSFTGGGGVMGAVKGLGSMISGALGSSLFGSLKDGKVVGGLFAGLTGTFASMIPAIGPAIGALVGPLMSGLAKLFGNHDAEDIMRGVGKDWGTKISDGLRDAILKDVKGGMTELAAEMSHMSDIIKEAGGLNASNFGTFTARLHDVFSLVERGELSTAQAATILDQNFAAFVTAGTDGAGRISDKLKEIITLNDRFGTQSKAIADFLQQQGMNAITGFNAVVAGTADAVKGYDAVKKAVDDAKDAASKLMAGQVFKTDDLQHAIDLVHQGAQQGGADLKAMYAEGEHGIAGIVAGLNLLGKGEAVDALENAMRAQQKAAAGAKQELSDLGIQAVASIGAAVAAGKTIAEALSAAHPALMTLKQSYSDLGLDIDNAALKQLLLQDTINTGAPQLMGAIGGLSQSMVALDNMGLLNVDTFAAMERTGAQMYTRLQGEAFNAGGTTKDALAPMQGWLHNAADEAAKLGIPLDANTQRMIDQSKDLGIWKDKGKDANQVLFDGVKLLVDKMTDFINQLTGMPTQAATAAGGVQGALNSIHTPSLPAPWADWGNPPSFTNGDGGSVSGAARGGLVTSAGIQYLASGGGPVGKLLAFAPRGSDTVPAMLTPGEGVVNRRGMSTLGASGLRSLNNGQGGGSVADFAEMRKEIAGLRADMAAQAQGAERRQHSHDLMLSNQISVNVAAAVAKAVGGSKRR